MVVDMPVFPKETIVSTKLLSSHEISFEERVMEMVIESGRPSGTATAKMPMA